MVKSHPTLPPIRVEGHTDSVGAAEFNRHLSRARAESVRAYLMRKGIAGQRLTSEGYGPDRPIAANVNAKGRAQNRRVEFVVADELPHLIDAEEVLK